MDSIEKSLKETETKLADLQKIAQAEQEFADKANILFECNMATFKLYFPEIFERFNEFVPKEKFKLFLNPDFTPNIIDYDTGVPMYSETPEQQVENQIQESLKHPELGQIDFSATEHIEDDDDFFHVRLMQKIGKCYNEAKSSLNPNQQVDEKIPSMVIFGVGLGYHLTRLNEITTASYISIFEPNEDYFYASMFSFDWTAYIDKIIKNDAYLYIGIGDSENQIYETIYKRVQEIGPFSISNSFFYLHYRSEKVAKLVNEIKKNFNQFFVGWGFFDDALMSVAHTLGVVKKAPSIINAEHQWSKDLAHFPIFIVANGPSLDADIEYIKTINEKVIVVSCNSATTALLAHGITPDFHVALERGKETADFLEEVIEKKYRDQINLLVLNVMYPGTLDLFPWVGIALKGGEAGTILYQLANYAFNRKITPTIGFSNPLVGNTALSFFTHMNFKNIYLFGVDSGYVDRNHHHSKLSFYYNDNGESIIEPIGMGEEIAIEGNFGGSVISEPFLYTGKEQMERLLTSFKDTGLTCYNCSNGAKIEGSLPLHSEDILIEPTQITKKQVIEKIKREAFSDLPEMDLTHLLEFEAFELMCETAVEILSEPFETRNEAIVSLMKHLRYLKSFKSDGRFAHLSMLIEGESLYVNATLISLLFNFGNAIEIMPIYRKALNCWIDFLNSAPDIYREKWNKESDHNFVFASK